MTTLHLIYYIWFRQLYHDNASPHFHIWLRQLSWQHTILFIKSDLGSCIMTTHHLMYHIWFRQLHHNNIPSHFSYMIQSFLAKYSHGMAGSSLSQHGSLWILVILQAENVIERYQISQKIKIRWAPSTLPHS